MLPVRPSCSWRLWVEKVTKASPRWFEYGRALSNDLDGDGCSCDQPTERCREKRFTEQQSSSLSWHLAALLMNDTTSFTALPVQYTHTLLLNLVSFASLFTLRQVQYPSYTDRRSLLPMSNRTQIIHAYRDLYKRALTAVGYSRLPRTVLRDRLRKAFRKGHRADFDPVRIRNTLQFLRGAAYPQTLERRVLHSLVHTWRMQGAMRTEKELLQLAPKTTEQELEIRRSAYDHFNHLVRMLNESMGMCIR